jgi:threonine dehydrogenase-like Zn-dependent dehydrogenase
VLLRECGGNVLFAAAFCICFEDTHVSASPLGLRKLLHQTQSGRQIVEEVFAMANKLALVTGASSGIGLGLAQELAERGYDLVVCSAGERLSGVVDELRSGLVQVTEVQADLATAEGIETLWNEVAAMGQPLDIASDVQHVYDSVKVALFLETDRPSVLRQAIQAVRKGGTVSIPGVYGGMLDKVPFGAAFGKGITMKMGQTHMHTYMRPLLEKIESGQIDPSAIISHRITLEEAPAMYEVWRDKKDGVTKIVIDPWAERVA